MIVPLTLLALLVPWLCGYLVILTITGKHNILSWMEHFALSFLIGSGILTLSMLIISMVGFKLTTFNIICSLIVILIYPTFINLKNGVKIPLPEKISFKLKWYEWVLVLAISLRVLFIFFEALIKPVIACDAFANWSLRAKVFFLDSCVPTNAPGNYLAGGGHLYYPINIPLLQTWMFNVIGSWNDQASKIIFPLLFLCLIIIFYCSIKRFAGRTLALLSTYLLTSLPLLTHHATIEYADLPLAIYFSCAALFLIEYIVSKERAYLIISALLAGIAAWTKSEGLHLMLILLFILVISEYLTKNLNKNSAVNIMLFILLGIIFKVPWSLFNIIYKVPRDIWQNIEYQNILENLGRLPIIADNFYRRMLFYGNWNIAWGFIVIPTVFAWKSLTKPRLMYSISIVIFSSFAFAAVYYITPSYTWLLDGTTVNRNFLVVMPLAIYFIAACMNEIYTKGTILKNNGHIKR